MKIIDVIGSGAPIFFLGSPLADSTTTRNILATAYNPYSQFSAQDDIACLSLKAVALLWISGTPGNWSALNSGKWVEEEADDYSGGSGTLPDWSMTQGDSGRPLAEWKLRCRQTRTYFYLVEMSSKKKHSYSNASFIIDRSRKVL